ncbi:MAG: family 20 glycosylhydrolase, partial [Planctomycetota bacterium]
MAKESESLSLAVHMMAPAKGKIGLLERFIIEAMPALGAETLVLEIDYRYDFRSHKELAAAEAIGRPEAKRIVEAARNAGVRIVPLFNCFGHQSWRENTFALLAEHPEWDEYPEVGTSDEEFYCRSWCPLAPGLHRIVFDLIDELATDFETSDFHCGMDEVFIIADEHCPRCRGKNPAEVFAAEVTVLYDHLREKGITMWIWGDRLLDGKALGINKWEASHNDTAGAIDGIPTDIIICDWHYEDSPATAAIFARKGFRVFSCPWLKKDVALAHLEKQRVLA